MSSVYWSSVQPQPQQQQQPPVLVEYGEFIDRDNNLDAEEAPLIPQSIAASAATPGLQFTVEDTTRLYGNHLRTYNYLIQNGVVEHLKSGQRRDMASRAELANFVADVLDNSEKAGAKVTCLELVDHGAGNGGCLFTQDPNGSINHASQDQITGSIQDGIALHAARHPEDKNRKINIVVMHVCFGLTTGYAYGFSKTGADMLVGGPETDIAPGVTSDVARVITDDINKPRQVLADDIVHTVMETRYHQNGVTYGPVAAFDVLAIDPAHEDPVAKAETNFDRVALQEIQSNPKLIHRLLYDANKVPGMQRDEPNLQVPWRSDRPAIALYRVFARDSKLPLSLQVAAAQAEEAINAQVLAHGETQNAVGFGKDYRDAVGPTTPFPTTVNLVDPLSPELSVTACLYSYVTLRNALIQAMLLQPQPGLASATA